ncbi:hypothetical protein H312_01063 [Anncaliia algerae PRA339]|uniref:T-cell immunomodulatory protein TIP C2 domain-containing protein n=1 Tax=Anncaliia algerae PRA339 TaxID=1288291 RepID=A0A059F2R6_9MICR|nr:hypothetical protein H312_01063 [Anncaliia algerae PRA339]
MDNAELYFDSEQLMISNFILYAYMDDGLIGTSLDKKTLLIYERKNDHSLNYQLRNQYVFPIEIYNVFLFDIGCKNKSFFVNFKSEDHFINKILIENEIIHLDKTTSAPFMVLDTQNRSSLVMQNNLNSYVLRIKYDRKFSPDKNLPTRMIFDNEGFLSEVNSDEVKIEKYSVKLKQIIPEHTSGYFLDDEDQAKLVLQTISNKKTYLSLYKKQSNEFYLVQENILPEKIGPFLFGDFFKNGFTSVAFLSEEDSSFYLNVFKNHGKNDYFKFESKFNKKIKLNEYLQYKTPNLTKNGSKVVDIFNDSFLHIVILLESGSNTELLLLKNDGSGNFYPSYGYFDGLRFAHLNSFSFNDLDFSGKEGLVLNYFEDGKQKLVYKKNNIHGNFYFSVVTFEENGLFPLPGISYKYIRMEDNEFRISNQLVQTSFPNLEHPHVFFGLGGAPFLVELTKVLVADFKTSGSHTFRVYQKIIPNSRISLKSNKYGLKMTLILNPDAKIKSIFFFFVVVLVINLVLLSVVHFLEKRKRKHDEKRSDNFVSTIGL